MPPKSTHAALPPDAHDPVDVSKIPTNDPIRLRAWVAAELQIRGYTQRSFAAAMGLKRQAIYTVINTPHHAAELALASFFGCHPADIWPQRYSRDRQARLYRSHIGDSRKNTAAPPQHNI